MRDIHSISARAEKRARRIAEKRMGLAPDDYIIEPVAEGASEKRFFRLFFKRAAGVSAVMMLLPKRFRLESCDYFQVSEIFRRINLPAPAVWEVFERDGAMLLDDLGDTSLYTLAPDLRDDEDALEELYRQAIDTVITLQTRAGFYSKGVAAFERAFDESKLGWELGFMMRHFCSGLLCYRPGKAEKRVLDSFFADLCARLASLPRVLCHRDYHSQNLVLRRGMLYVTDFQDARLGPHVYDLVSLLRDSYVDLGDRLPAELQVYYLEKHPDFEPRDGNTLAMQFDLMSLQRHLKHLGTFGYQACHGRPAFLEFVPLTLRYLETNFGRFPDYAEAAKILSGVFDIAREKLAAEESEQC